MQPTTITLLRDSKSRFGFAIGADAMGIVVTKIAQTDALPQAGLIDERGRMNVGDIVTRVGEVQLVNASPLPTCPLHSCPRSTRGR